MYSTLTASSKNYKFFMFFMLKNMYAEKKSIAEVCYIW